MSSPPWLLKTRMAMAQLTSVAIRHAKKQHSLNRAKPKSGAHQAVNDSTALTQLYRMLLRHTKELNMVPTASLLSETDLGQEPVTSMQAGTFTSSMLK